MLVEDLKFNLLVSLCSSKVSLVSLGSKIIAVGGCLNYI